MKAKFDSVEYVRSSRPPKLRFVITITNDGERSRFYSFRGQVRLVLKDSDPSIVNEWSIILNDVYDADNQILDIDHDKSRQVELEFILDPYQKTVIEDNREGDLRFRIYLRAYRIDSIEEKFGFNREQCHVEARYGIDIDIPRSKWADILSEAGYDQYQILEIPIDYGEIISYSQSLKGDGFQDRIKKASDQLVKILRDMDEGNWRKAVGDCRLVLEALTKGIVRTTDGQTISTKKAISELLNKSGFSEKNIQSFHILIEQMKSFASLQHHIKSESGEEIELPVPMEREDALFAVSTVATIINLLSRKIKM
jgi:hypothetical protein